MQAVILAAGQSSRFWPINNQNKSLIKIMGRPLIYYTIQNLKKTGIKQIIIIQSPDKSIEKELKNYKFPNCDIKYVIQKKPLGMGNALWQAKNLLKDNFLVLNAERMDIDEIIQSSKLKIKSFETKNILFGEKIDTPELFGIAKLKGNKIRSGLNC